jgi:PAS domain S-box-containing protein
VEALFVAIGAGIPVSVSVSIEPIQGDQGQPVATLIVCHRITPWKDAAAALRRSEERLKLALSAARLGAWEYDLNARVLTTSSQCKANHGFAENDDLQLETQILPAIDPGPREAFRAAIDGAIASSGSFETEVPQRWPDGSRHWLLVAGRVIDPTCMVGVTQDISDRRHIEQSVRDSEERFRMLADNIAQFAWMADATGSRFWHNRRWLDYTGRTLEEMKGWGWQTVHHPDHVQAVVARLRRCVETGEPWEDTFPLRAADGTYRWFLARAVPIRDPNGRVVRWFGTNTDVTDQRAKEEALVLADRNKDEFLALVAHELRSPLSPILAAVRLLMLTGPPDPALQKLRETILRQTLHLSRVVDDLLDVGRIISGKLRLDHEVADLNAIVKQAMETCSPEIERRRHTLQSVLAESPFYVDVDAARIVQVVCNLLNNAAKYMRDGGRIELTVSAHDSMAVICVRDEGVGIGPEMLGRLFHRFVQVDSSRHRAQGGLGIGLALVKAIIDMHGGTVEATSEGIGKGSVFTVRLPTVAATST